MSQESQFIDDPDPMPGPSGSQSQSQKHYIDNSAHSSLSLSQASSQSSCVNMVVPVTPSAVASDDEFRPCSQLSSTPKRTEIRRGNKRIPIVPLTRQQVVEDPRYYLRDFFTLVVDQGKVKWYICNHCRADVWAHSTTLDHFHRHLDAKGTHKHSDEIREAFKALVASRRTRKRPHPASTEAMGSDPKKKQVSPRRLLHHAVYSQTDFETDTVTEVVMNMLPFEVR